jgi:hypothetical protein
MATLTFSHPCPKQKLKREVCGNYLKKTNQCGSIHRQPGFRIQRGCFVLKGAPYLLTPSALPPAVTTFQMRLHTGGASQWKASPSPCHRPRHICGVNMMTLCGL